MKVCNACRVAQPLNNFDRKGEGHAGRCKACRSREKAARYLANRDRERGKRKANREANPEAAAARHARWATANAQRLKAYQDAYRLANTARKAEYQTGKQAERTAQENARRALKLKASPAWANPAAIQGIYGAARTLQTIFGTPYHVDHIVPLQGPTVCGLHVENNLQILPAADNIKKGNRVWPDMPKPD